MFNGFGEVYTVVSGDTLGKIAKKYNTTVDAIAKQNNIQDVDKIEVGQVLNIGEAKTSQTVQTAPSFSLPKFSMPPISNAMINYALIGGILALGVPLAISFVKRRQSKKQR